MLKKASEVIASGDEAAIVDYAIEVNRRVSAASGELEEAKSHLRELALGRVEDQESGSVEIEGNLGAATIVFTPHAVRPLKGADLRDAEVNLSAETFARLFTKEIVIQPVRDFQDRLGALTAAERAVVERFIEIRPSTPKVNLPR